MKVFEIMQEKVAPIVKELFTEVDFTNFRALDTVTHSLKGIHEASRDFNLVNEVAVVAMEKEFRAKKSLLEPLTQIGELLREDMGEEIYEAMKEEKGAEDEFDLGFLFMFENLYGAVFQKVQGFETIDYLPHANLVMEIKSEMDAEFDSLKDSVTIVVRTATITLIESLKVAELDYINLPFEEFDEEFIKRGEADVLHEGKENKILNNAFNSIMEMENGGETIAKVVVASGTSPLEAMLNNEEVIGTALSALVQIAMQVAHKWVNDGTEGNVDEATIKEAISQLAD